MIGSMTTFYRRFGPLDIAITLVAVAMSSLMMLTEVGNAETPDAAYWATPLFALTAVPLLWRRIAPLAASGAILAALGLHVAIFQNDVIRCGTLLPIALVMAYAAGAHLDRRPALAGLGITLLICLLVCLSDEPSGADLEAMLFVGPVAVAVWLAGQLVRSRGRMADELRRRTSELRTARDERARLQVADDRARLSSELDGLLQTRLSELAALADAGDASDPAAAAEALARIEHTSRDTLRHMRAMVGALRGDDEGAPSAPPVLTHLEAMLVRSKGMGAHLSVEGTPRALPAGVELSAYRVVEHLLDAVQDAPGVEVGVRFDDAALELRVTGPLRRRGAAAIERARERATLENGRLEASTDGGRAEARVSLPILAAV